jgi:hypothetical protein
LRRDKGVSGLLQFRVGIEALEVGQSVHGHIRGEVFVLELVGLNDPWVLQSLFGGWSLVLIECQKLGNKILGLFGNSSPDWVSKRELAALDFLHDLLVGSTIEWWDTRQSDESNNTA